MTAVIRTGALRGYRELVRELGGNPTALLRRYRIDPDSLDDEDALIPLRSQIHLMEHSAKVLQCPDIGLRLGHRQDIGILGPLAVQMQHSRTAGEAVLCVSRRLFVQSQAVALTILRRSPQASGLAEMRFEFTEETHPFARQFMDHCLAVLDRIARFLAMDRYQLHAVCLDHTPHAPISSYRRIFGAPVRVAQKHAALLVAPGFFDAPLRSANRALAQMAAEHLDAHFTDPGHAIAGRVRLILSRSLGAVAVTRERAATLLSLHPRTLQRHLAAEGVSFEELRESVRREATLRYICSTHLAFGQIAELVGLSKGSALTRCCLRWFGKTPTALRRDEGQD